MSKFLRIIEQSIPSEHNSSKHKMVSTLVQLLDSIHGIDVSVVDHNTFTVDVNGNTITLDVRDIEKLNEASTGASFNPVYNLDKEVEKQAAKAKFGGLGSSLIAGTAARKANAAVKERDAVASGAIDLYNNITNDLKKTIQKAKSWETKPDII
jgi:hypothetical protein